MKLYFDLDNFINENVIGSTLYKKEKYGALAKNIAILTTSVLGIIIWIEVLLKEPSLAMNFFYLKSILFLCVVITFIFCLVTYFYFDSKTKDYTFLRSYDKDFDSFEKLINLKKENSFIKNSGNRVSIVCSTFSSLFLSSFFEDFLKGELVAQIYFVLLFVFIYFCIISLIDIVLLVSNFSLLKYDCLLEMINTYKILKNNSKKSIFEKIINFVR